MQCECVLVGKLVLDPGTSESDAKIRENRHAHTSGQKIALCTASARVHTTFIIRVGVVVVVGHLRTLCGVLWKSHACVTLVALLLCRARCCVQNVIIQLVPTVARSIFLCVCALSSFIRYARQHESSPSSITAEMQLDANVHADGDNDCAPRRTASHHWQNMLISKYVSCIFPNGSPGRTQYTPLAMHDIVDFASAFAHRKWRAQSAAIRQRRSSQAEQQQPEQQQQRANAIIASYQRGPTSFQLYD